MSRVLGLDPGSYSLKAVVLESTPREPPSGSGRAAPQRRGHPRRGAGGARRRASPPPGPATIWWWRCRDSRWPRTPSPLPFTDAKRIAATLPSRWRESCPSTPSQVVLDAQPTRRHAGSTDLPGGAGAEGRAGQSPSRHSLPMASTRGWSPIRRSPTRTSSSPRRSASRSRPEPRWRWWTSGTGRTSVAVGRPAEGLIFAPHSAGGGRDLTRALAAEFKVGLPEAEAWKERDASLVAREVRARLGPARRCLRALAPIVREVRATLKASSSHEHQPGGAAPGRRRQRAAPWSARAPGNELSVPTDRALLPAIATAVISRDDQPRACQAYALRAARGGSQPGAAVQPPPGRVRLPRSLRLPPGAAGPGGGLAAALVVLLGVAQSSPGRSCSGRREAAVDARLCGAHPAGAGDLRYELRPGAQHAARQGEPRRRRPWVSAVNLLAETLQRVPPDLSVTFSQMVVDLDRIQLRGNRFQPLHRPARRGPEGLLRCFREVKEGKVERAKDSRG